MGVLTVIDKKQFSRVGRLTKYCVCATAKITHITDTKRSVMLQYVTCDI